jgi:hypothetical protein
VGPFGCNSHTAPAASSRTIPATVLNRSSYVRGCPPSPIPCRAEHRAVRRCGSAPSRSDIHRRTPETHHALSYEPTRSAFAARAGSWSLIPLGVKRLFVTPVEAGVKGGRRNLCPLDSRFRGNDVRCRQISLEQSDQIETASSQSSSPGIHGFSSWMDGPSPAMTSWEAIQLNGIAPNPRKPAPVGQRAKRSLDAGRLRIAFVLIFQHRIIDRAARPEPIVYANVPYVRSASRRRQIGLPMDCSDGAVLPTNRLP